MTQAEFLRRRCQPGETAGDGYRRAMAGLMQLWYPEKWITYMNKCCYSASREEQPRLFSQMILNTDNRRERIRRIDRVIADKYAIYLKSENGVFGYGVFHFAACVWVLLGVQNHGSIRMYFRQR